MLFVPFLELKLKQNLSQVKDNNIGMGLACSEQITTALGGDITIKESRKGFTVFAFKIPVKIKNDASDHQQGYIQINEVPNIMTMSQDLRDYIKLNKLKQFMMVDFDKIQVQQKNISAISTNKIGRKRNVAKNINHSYRANPVKSKRSFKFGDDSKNSEENLLNLNSLGNLKKPRVQKEKGSRAGSESKSLGRRRSLLRLGCK